MNLAHEDACFVHRVVLAEILSTWFHEQTLIEAGAALRRARLPFAPYRTLADLVADDARELRQLPLFGRLDQPGIDSHYAAGCPLVMAGRSLSATAAPGIGQHTDEGLAETMGYDDGENRRLREAGVIGGPPR